MADARATFGVIFGVGFSLVGTASAAEYCVSCAGPVATYRCQIGLAEAESRPDPRFQFACISELARQGGHATCSVNRVQPGDCAGEVKTVAAPGDPPEGMPVIAAPPKAAEGAETVTEPAPDIGKPVETKEETEKPPQTVEEMARKSAKTSGEALSKAGDAVKDGAAAAGAGVEKAGSAVGKAAKGTWHCITSLFSDC